MIENSHFRAPALATSDVAGRTVVAVVPRGKHILIRLPGRPGRGGAEVGSRTPHPALAPDDGTAPGGLRPAAGRRRPRAPAGDGQPTLASPDRPRGTGPPRRQRTFRRRGAHPHQRGRGHWAGLAHHPALSCDEGRGGRWVSTSRTCAWCPPGWRSRSSAGDPGRTSSAGLDLDRRWNG
ncbi:hypothetical protein QJS66_17205 [Kocuria rhizophila]|nr:hypothetical protein QJS66_17205 [Kocuria rhizophila]